ncbi:hypothetical protein M378DRAFT_167248 [Amanita muscaria Koide BX008]|uniref:Uncharacterized protein n=1 Tax=Amanita muscaria (strain Koide BX008) TaxID=946122 RepID=A0A0C2WWQ6_AMAMK|nr:hypothetical protein M378DRAFT_167248 [Amanita muscaria Koide BX008]
MEVNPSRSCRNAGFSKGGGSGEQAQHLELPQEAMVVVERTPTPSSDLHSTKDYWLNSDVDWCKILSSS